MGMIWQMLGHIWPICGNDMGRLDDPIFDKFQAMENAWEGKPMPSTVWKNYGNKMPICIP